MLCIFEKNLKIPNDRLFGRVKNSLKLGKASLHRSPVDQNIGIIAVSCTVFEIQAFFVFCNFCEKFKMAAIFDGTNFFLKIGSATQQLSCGSKIWSKPLYLVFEIQAFLCCACLKKIPKFKMATIFDGTKFF